MTASKRKNENVDDVANQLTKMVIVGERDEKESSDDHDSPNNSLTIIDRMKKLSGQWQEEKPIGFVGDKNSDETELYDAISQSIASVIKDKRDTEIQNSLSEQAIDIKSHLSHKIVQAKDLRRKETDVLGELSEQLLKFEEQRQHLLSEIEKLDNRQRLSQEKIAKYQAEASQELDMIIDVEEEQKQQVPRLKMTISLYASTTGIKWDFADPNVLSGQVEIPSQKSFKLFSIDPRDFSSVETADMLWSFMEGIDVQ